MISTSVPHAMFINIAIVFILIQTQFYDCHTLFSMNLIKCIWECKFNSRIENSGLSGISYCFTLNQALKIFVFDTRYMLTRQQFFLVIIKNTQSCTDSYFGSNTISLITNSLGGTQSYYWASVNDFSLKASHLSSVVLLN